MMFEVREKYTDFRYIVYGVTKEITDSPKFLIYKDNKFQWVWAINYKPV